MKVFAYYLALTLVAVLCPPVGVLLFWQAATEEEE
jgi:hypothetical protein